MPEMIPRMPVLFEGLVCERITVCKDIWGGLVYGKVCMAIGFAMLHDQLSY